MTALAQAFYLSEPFRALEIETMDYREHPVLGGISSTRWAAYDAFQAKNGRLAQLLENRSPLPLALQLQRHSRPAAAWPPALPITSVRRRHHQLESAGMLAGDGRANALQGSDEDDVLIGGRGNDSLDGGRGDDILCGGKGSDVFHIGAAEPGAGSETDRITDFHGERGDRLQLSGGRLIGGADFSGTAAEIQVLTWMADPTADLIGRLEPWQIQGVHLLIDRDGDRQADLLIDLPGIGLFEPEWLITA
ncbi:MAG: hypothetical protein ACKOXO_01200 [Cyanobium sp.]